jgi:hypothetical protein
MPYVRTYIKRSSITDYKWYEYLTLIALILLFVGKFLDDGFNTSLAEVRQDLHSYVSYPTQIGTALFYGYLFLLVAFFSTSHDSILSRVLILIGLLVPIFAAGRQLYLILFLIAFLSSGSLGSLIYKKISYQKTKFVRIVIGSALGLILFVSIVRFDIDSQLAFGSKLEMFNSISSTNMRDSYLVIYEFLPYDLAGVLIEASYYFGSQIGRFIELFELNDFSLFSFYFFDKFPFIARNLQKVIAFTGVVLPIKTEQFIDGNIMPFTWSTSVFANVSYFGTIGSLLISYIFGSICKISHKAYIDNPDFFPAKNFLVGNYIIISYSIISSPLMDTYFLFYYIFSFAIFFKKIRFFRI